MGKMSEIDMRQRELDELINGPPAASEPDDLADNGPLSLKEEDSHISSSFMSVSQEEKAPFSFFGNTGDKETAAADASEAEEISFGFGSAEGLTPADETEDAVDADDDYDEDDDDPDDDTLDSEAVHQYDQTGKIIKTGDSTVSSNNGESSKTAGTDAANPAAEEEKRKADWEQKQAKKRADQEKRWQEVQNMDADTAAIASLAVLNKGIERLTKRNMKIEVGQHIRERCEEDSTFARKVMHPQKDIVRCFKYINKKAGDYLMEEMKQLRELGEAGDAPSMGEVMDVPDEMCYAWAIEYFETLDLEIDKNKDEDEYKPKYTPRTAKKAQAPAKKKEEKAKPALRPQKQPSILEDMKPFM